MKSAKIALMVLQVSKSVMEKELILLQKVKDVNSAANLRKRQDVQKLIKLVVKQADKSKHVSMSA